VTDQEEGQRGRAGKAEGSLGLLHADSKGLLRDWTKRSWDLDREREGGKSNGFFDVFSTTRSRKLMKGEGECKGAFLARGP